MVSSRSEVVMLELRHASLCALVTIWIVCPPFAAEAAPAKIQRSTPDTKPSAAAKRAKTAKPKTVKAPAKPAAIAKPAEPTKPKDPIEAATALLGSSDRKQVALGLTRLSSIGKPACVGPIIDRLERGLPPRLTLAAIEALGLLGDPRAHRPLMALLLHRRGKLRSAAADTLGAMRAKSANQALIARLDDPEPEVRAAAVGALGSIGNHQSFDPLREALEQGEHGAAMALGTIATRRDIPKLIAIARARHFEDIKPALQMFADRSDLPVSAKVTLVKALGALDDPATKQFLKHLLENLQVDGRKVLIRAIGKALQRIQDREAKSASAAKTVTK